MLYVVTHECISTPHSPGGGVLTGPVYVLFSIGNSQLYSSVVTLGDYGIYRPVGTFEVHHTCRWNTVYHRLIVLILIMVTIDSLMEDKPFFNYTQNKRLKC